MTFPDFAKTFALLATVLRATDADEMMARSYFAVLITCELEFIQMAADRFAKGETIGHQENGIWFPKAPEWRQMAAKVENERRDTQRELMRKSAAHWCAACSDTSWEPMGNGVRPCACRSLRRLELLGRRPWPALPAAPIDAAPIQVHEAKALVGAIAAGKSVTIRTMPAAMPKKKARDLGHVARQITESIQRCEALEQKPDGVA